MKKAINETFETKPFIFHSEHKGWKKNMNLMIQYKTGTDLFIFTKNTFKSSKQTDSTLAWNNDQNEN